MTNRISPLDKDKTTPFDSKYDTGSETKGEQTNPSRHSETKGADDTRNLQSKNLISSVTTSDQEIPLAISRSTEGDQTNLLRHSQDDIYGVEKPKRVIIRGKIIDD